MRALPAIVLGGCCLPVTEVHRPPVTGRVLLDGRPVAGATVHVCTFSSWGEPECRPPRVAETVTGDDGAFSLPAETSFPTVVFGEAPLLESVVWVCRPEGAASAILGFTLPPTPLPLVLDVGTPPVSHGEVRTGGADLFATARCP